MKRTLNDPPCPICGMMETAHAEYPEPSQETAIFVCLCCGHKFNDNLYGQPRRPTPEVHPEKIRLLGFGIPLREASA